MKRSVGVILIALFMVLLAACGVPSSQVVSSPAPSPTVAATSRDAREEPVQVDETYAMSNVTEPTALPSTPTAVIVETEDPTPATGDVELVYIVGTIGLILFCSAGLLLLRRV